MEDSDHENNKTDGANKKTKARSRSKIRQTRNNKTVMEDKERAVLHYAGSQENLHKIMGKTSKPAARQRENNRKSITRSDMHELMEDEL